jgi:2,5-diamino-6-(ribosylamino)-4(3H)-pyrimidinone 5'-phosphate reductase
MTLDGKIATKTGSSKISGKEDLVRVHKLRKKIDAIMVGINTLLADDPRLTVHKIDAKPKDNPVRIVVDSYAKTPLNFRILNGDAPTIIATTENADPEKVEELGKKATVLKYGKDRVDLKLLMEELSRIGINTLMLEGGSTLNYSMLENGLVDEVRVCVAPMIVGGVQSKTLVGGEGINQMIDAIKLKLIKSYSLGPDLILEYKLLN